MNLLLFATEEDLRHIRPGDPRLAHVRQVLKAEAGGRIYAGVLGGSRAWASILSDSAEDGMRLLPQWEAQQPPQLLPLRVIVGLPRPQTARKILFEAAVLGIANLDFFVPEKGEPSYAQSSLWQSDEWQQRLIQGAEQACVTTLPQVRHFTSLAQAVQATPSSSALNPVPHVTDTASDKPVNSAQTGLTNNPQPEPHATNSKVQATPASADSDGTVGACLHEIRLALDVYEAVAPLSRLLPPGQAPGRVITLAIGSERGWSATERDTLRSNDFILTDIGARVLRTETALISAVALVADKLLVPQEA